MAVHRELDLAELGAALAQVVEHPGVLDRRREADGVRQVDDRRSRRDRLAARSREERAVRPRRVLGRELDLVGVLGGVCDRPGDPLQHLRRSQPELALHVQRARRDEDVDAAARCACERLGSGVDVAFGRSGKRCHGGARHRVDDCGDALEVTGRRGGEPRLHDVDTEQFEGARDLGLLVRPQRDARRLLAVPQSRVEDLDPAHSLLLAGVSVRRRTSSVDGGRMRRLTAA